MMFWVIIALVAAGVAAWLARAMARAKAYSPASRDFDVQVYRDQLAEVDRDVTRGVLGVEDAERVRTEISRRILAADAAVRKGPETSRAGSAPVWSILIALVLVGGSGGLYFQLGAPGYGDLGLEQRIALAEESRKTRPSQANAEAGVTAAQPAQQDEAYVQMVAQLREVLTERPDDLRGWRLLAVSERNLGNFAQAAKAQARTIDIMGDDASSAHFSDLANSLVLAAGGYVSPEAETALTRALELDPGNGAARYYWGLMMAQIGRADQAFRIWDQLLRQGPPEAPWIQPILAQIQDAAVMAGVNYTVPQPGSAIRGPSADDVEAAGDMSVSDRMEMIEGMVSSLSERLASEGGNVQEWAQLITALGVLGRSGQAFAIYDEATRVFANDPGAMDVINRAGDRAGVAN